MGDETRWRPSSPSEATLPRGCAGQPTGRVSGGPGNVRCSCDQPARPCAIATEDRRPRTHRVAHAAPPLRPVGAVRLAPRGGPRRRGTRRDAVRHGGLRHDRAVAQHVTVAGGTRTTRSSPRSPRRCTSPRSSSTPPTSTSSTTASTSSRSPTAGSSTPPVVTTIHGFSSARILPAYERYDDTTAYVAISDADRHPALHYAATIHHGIDTAAFAVDPDPGDHLLFFGRIHPDKGTATAIDVAARAGRRLVIAGIIHDQRYYDEQVAPHVDGDRSATSAR